MERDFALFRRRLLRNPRQVSALAPSSHALARAMTCELGPQAGRVVEFGPGTGRFTEEILARGVAPHDLTLFEVDREFARFLRGRFPGVAVLEAGAEHAAAHVEPGVGQIVSGLPLLSFPREQVAAILSAAFSILAPGGCLVQFTYGPRPPVPESLLSTLGLRAEPGPRIWANLPPARIYRFRHLQER